MVSDPMDLDNVGAYTDNIYSVKSLGKPEKSDLSWYTKTNMEMGDFFELSELTDKAKEYIMNYWSGKASENPVWEYRSINAIIIKELTDEDLIKIEKKIISTKNKKVKYYDSNK